MTTLNSSASDLPQEATSAKTSATPNQLARKLIKQLQTQFSVFDEHLPLAIGVDKQLKAKLPEIDKKVLRIALGIHTNSMRYLFNVAKAQKRVDLDGNEIDDISEEHRSHAANLLKEQSKKNAAAKKAKIDAEKAQKQAELAEKQHQEKLSQLAAKFSKK